MGTMGMVEVLDEDVKSNEDVKSIESLVIKTTILEREGRLNRGRNFRQRLYSQGDALVHDTPLSINGYFPDSYDSEIHLI